MCGLCINCHQLANSQTVCRHGPTLLLLIICNAFCSGSFPPLYQYSPLFWSKYYSRSLHPLPFLRHLLALLSLHYYLLTLNFPLALSSLLVHCSSRLLILVSSLTSVLSSTQPSIYRPSPLYSPPSIFYHSFPSLCGTLCNALNPQCVFAGRLFLLILAKTV